MSGYHDFPRRPLEYFEPIMPLVRAQSREGLLGSYDDIVAVYSDCIVKGKCRYLETIHDRISDPKTLAASLHAARIVPINELTRAQFYPGGRRRRVGRVRIEGGSPTTFEIPLAESEHVLAYLQARLGEGLTIHRRVYWHGFFLNLLIVATLAAAAFSLRLGQGSFFVGIGLAALAALLAAIQVYDHVPAPAPWLEAPVRRQKDRAGRSPFRSLIAGWTLKILCAAGLFASLYGNDDISRWVYRNVVAGFTASPDTASLILSVLTWTFRIVALGGLYGGHLLTQRTVNYVRTEDTRAPILYLRSFDSDRKQTLVVRSRWAIMSGVLPQSYLPSPWCYILMANPIRILRVLFGRGADTCEEQLGLWLKKRGPFIAIGRPGEKFASPGAARTYVTNDQWQNVVDSYLDESQLIVLQPANSQGVWWEVNRVLEKVSLDKVLVCLVNFHRRQNDYEAFRLRSLSHLKMPLPHSGGLTSTPSFVSFQRDGSSTLLPTSYRAPLSWPLAGNAVDLEETLKTHFASAEQPQPRNNVAIKPPLGISFASHCIATCFYLFIIVGTPLAWQFGPLARRGVPLESRAAVLANSPMQTMRRPTARSNPAVEKLLADADALIVKKQFQEADGLISKAIEIAPNDPKPHEYRGLSLKLANQLPEALAEFEHAKKLGGDEVFLVGVIGQTQLSLNQLEGAEQSFTRAIELNPNQGNFYFNRGFVRYKREEFDGAAADLAKSIELKTDDPALGCELCALAFQKAGKTIQAMPYFNTAVKLKPDNADWQLARAQAFQEMGAQQFTDGNASEFAQKGFEEVLRLAPDSQPARLGRGIALQRQKKHEAAIVDFNVLVSKEPKVALLYWKRGYSHLALGHYRQAGSDGQSACELDPKHQMGVDLLIRTCVAQGKFPEALQHSEKVASSSSKQPFEVYQNAVLLFLSGDKAAAAKARQESVPKLWESPQSNLHICGAMLSLLAPRNEELARQALARLGELEAASPDVPMLSLITAAIQIRLQNFAAAKEKLSKLDSKTLNDMTEAFYNLCEVEMGIEQGDPSSANESLTKCAQWFEKNCPIAFSEGEPETLGDDWTSRSVLGMLYREAKTKIDSLPK